MSHERKSVILKIETKNMELILKDLFDVNTGEKHRHNFEEMSEALYLYFEDRTYSPMVNRIVIDMICSIQFRMPYRKKPIYHEDKYEKVNRGCDDITYRLYHLMFVDIPLPDYYSTSDTYESIKIVEDTLIDYFKNVVLPVKIRNTFDKERFVADLKTFFDGYLENLSQ